MESKEPLYDFELTGGEVKIITDALTICAEGWAGGINRDRAQQLIDKFNEINRYAK